jgi:hypothetical protein
MTAVEPVQGIRRYVAGALWCAWATVIWAGTSSLLLGGAIRVPVIIQQLTFLSGAIALIGGCCGALYLVIGARTRALIISGVIATLANFAYVWEFTTGIMANPP